MASSTATEARWVAIATVYVPPPASTPPLLRTTPYASTATDSGEPASEEVIHTVTADATRTTTVHVPAASLASSTTASAVATTHPPPPISTAARSTTTTTESSGSGMIGPSDPRGTSAGAVAGIAVSALVVLVGIITLVFIGCVRRRTAGGRDGGGGGGAGAANMELGDTSRAAPRSGFSQRPYEPCGDAQTTHVPDEPPRAPFSARPYTPPPAHGQSAPFPRAGEARPRPDEPERDPPAAWSPIHHHHHPVRPREPPPPPRSIDTRRGPPARTRTPAPAVPAPPPPPVPPKSARRAHLRPPPRTHSRALGEAEAAARRRSAFSSRDSIDAVLGRAAPPAVP